MLAGWASSWLLALYFSSTVSISVMWEQAFWMSTWIQTFTASVTISESCILPRYGWEWTALQRKQPGRCHPEKRVRVRVGMSGGATNQMNWIAHYVLGFHWILKITNSPPWTIWNPNEIGPLGWFIWLPKTSIIGMANPIRCGPANYLFSSAVLLSLQLQDLPLEAIVRIRAHFQAWRWSLIQCPMNLSQGPFLSCVLTDYDPEGKGTLLLLTTVTT